MLIYHLINLAGVIALLCGFLFGRLTKYLLIPAIAVILAMVSIKCLLLRFPLYELQMLSWDFYPYIQSSWPLIIMLFAIGVAAAQLTRLRDRIAIGVAAMLVVSYTYWQTRWIYATPPGDATVVADSSHHCEQSSTQTCTPAACVAALSYFKIPANEKLLAERCLTRDTGTTLAGTLRGLKLSLDGKAVLTVEEQNFPRLIAKGSVAVITIQTDHAVCTIGTGKDVFIHDPKLPVPRRCSVEELQKIYQGPTFFLSAAK